MQILTTVTIVLFAWLVFYIAGKIISTTLAKRRGTVLKSQAFIDAQQANRGQLVDVRDKEPFKRSHLKNARNMPALSFSQGKSGLRHDMDIYLYGDTLQGASSVAKHLRKEGIDKNHLFLMAGGYRQLTESQPKK